MTHLGVRFAGVLQSAHTHHVAALLVIGVGVEQVIAHILQHGLDLRTGHLGERTVGIGDGRLIEHVFHGDI